MIKKLGLVLECCRDGADERVLKCLTRRLSPDTEVKKVAAMQDKRKLMQQGVDAAEKLLTAEKCERVFIVWDLQPEWQDDKGEPFDCEEECDLLRAQLADRGIEDKVDLICILQMLETWIVADHPAVSAHLSRPTHPYNFSKVKKLETNTDTKALLIEACIEARGRGNRYNDRLDAVRVIQRVEEPSRLQKVGSFRRFVNKLTGNEESSFQRCGDVCNDLAQNIAPPFQAGDDFLS
jgi:hypothetical protein